MKPRLRARPATRKRVPGGYPAPTRPSGCPPCAGEGGVPGEPYRFHTNHRSRCLDAASVRVRLGLAGVPIVGVDGAGVAARRDILGLLLRQPFAIARRPRLLIPVLVLSLRLLAALLALLWHRFRPFLKHPSPGGELPAATPYEAPDRPAMYGMRRARMGFCHCGRRRVFAPASSAGGRRSGCGGGERLSYNPSTQEPL